MGNYAHEVRTEDPEKKSSVPNYYADIYYQCMIYDNDAKDYYQKIAAQ